MSYDSNIERYARNMEAKEIARTCSTREEFYDKVGQLFETIDDADNFWEAYLEYEAQEDLKSVPDEPYEMERDDRATER